MSEQKNKGGRPRRVPGQKLQRVTLNLRPSIMFGLELIARDRQTSLSQAAEFVLAGALRDYEIDGNSAFKIAALGVVADIKTGDRFIVGREELVAAGAGKDVADKTTAIFNALHGSPEFTRVLAMPERLWTPEERYMIEALRGAQMMAIHENWREIYAVIQEHFRLGYSLADAQSAIAALKGGDGETVSTKRRTKKK